MWDRKLTISPFCNKTTVSDGHYSRPYLSQSSVCVPYWLRFLWRRQSNPLGKENQYLVWYIPRASFLQPGGAQHNSHKFGGCVTGRDGCLSLLCPDDNRNRFEGTIIATLMKGEFCALIVICYPSLYWFNGDLIKSLTKFGFFFFYYLIRKRFLSIKKMLIFLWLMTWGKRREFETFPYRERMENLISAQSKYNATVIS